MVSLETKHVNVVIMRYDIRRVPRSLQAELDVSSLLVKLMSLCSVPRYVLLFFALLR
jgi:hypothetical protein